jgi:starch phosphorylase
MQKSSLFKEWGIFHKGYDNRSLKYSFANHLEYSLSKDKFTATTRDLYYSLALSVRDRLIEQWINTQQLYHNNDVKRVYYLSAEYLMGRALVNNLINLDIYNSAKKAMSDLNLNLSELAEEEAEPGLGNGGLGRLAACFLDSLATLEIPSHGYGIRYEFGIFRQIIRNLGQEEQPDAWLQLGNPWEIKRPEYNYRVKFYGELKDMVWPDGSLKTEWINTTDVIGIAYDTPIAGYNNQTVNTLRLWSSRASTEFDLAYFQHGDYLKAVEEKNISENISKVLYPNDNNFEGKELRLKQQYFFVSCSIQDIIRRYMTEHHSFDEFPDKAAIQMNDTHPSLAIVELMRLLIDEQHLAWDNAWDITSRTCAYTNHTILSEALEEWPVSMFGKLLPRHLQIIFEINRRFLRRASIKHIGDNDCLERVSIIKEGKDKKIRMSHLAIIGSHSVNGVAKLHTKLLKSTIFKDFDDFYPSRIINITNGITPRRWLLECNPNLADLVSSKIGKGWIKDLDQLKEIEKFSEDTEFHKQFNDIKKRNKTILTAITEELTGFVLNPDSIFDVQIKRIHEYKRQLLNILHVITLWLQTKDGEEKNIHPRTFIFAGKTAPNYYISKMIIKLICYAAEIINSDPAGLIKVVFLPNYNVTLAERIIPASDLSEQISTAGYEASGTGNMKLALNGALTIGTLDGANIEIKDRVGKENIFVFGLKTDEVEKLRHNYNPREYYLRTPLLKKTIDLIRDGFFSPESPDLFHALIDNLLNMDRFMVLADFDDYKRCQKEVDNSYKDRKSWTTKAILNVARMGFFSSDHTIKEYNRQIWGAKPLHITLPERKKANNSSPEEIKSSF